MSYDGRNTARATVSVQNNPLAVAKQPDGQTELGRQLTPVVAEAAGWPQRADGSPDFERMNSAQRRTYDGARLTRKFG